MRGRSVVASVLSWAPQRRLLVVLGFALLTLPLGSLAIIFTPPGAQTATWWPAAGAAVLAVACSRGNRVVAAVLVMLATVLSNYIAGRPLPVAIAFGFANAIEAWIVCRIAANEEGVVKLASISGAVRFIVATAAGSITIGILAGATVAITGSEFAPTAAAAAAAHASAILVIVPLFLLPAAAYQVRLTPEYVAQLVILIVAIAFVFWPGQIYPYAFLPFPILAWAAFRFRSGTVFVQSILVAVATMTLTIVGGGPFAATAFGDPQLALHALQAFIVSLAVTSLVISEGHNERDRLIAGIEARETVLRSGILASTGGIVVVEGSPSRTLRLAVFNEGAAMLFPTEDWRVGERFSIDDVPASIVAPFIELARGKSMSWSGSLTTADELTLQVKLTRVNDDISGFVLTIEVEDVTSRRRAMIADANALSNEKATVDRLTDLNRQKDDFVSSVSHELRTPVTSILGYSEELEALDLDDEARGYVATIVRNAHRLRALIEDLLLVGSAASAHAKHTPELVDVDQLISHIRDDLAARADASEVELTISAKAKAGTLRTVRSELERIMSNLISNAVKFTPSGGSVTISASRSQDHLHLRVVDTGVGVPAEDLENVFLRFFRSKSTTLLPGTGLGLPITKELVEGLGGSIHLISDGKTGTEVLVSLPLEWPLFEL